MRWYPWLNPRYKYLSLAKLRKNERHKYTPTLTIIKSRQVMGRLDGKSLTQKCLRLKTMTSGTREKVHEINFHKKTDICNQVLITMAILLKRDYR